MNTKTLLMLALVTSGRAQTLDKAKLDQLFDRLLEKNKGMGSLTLIKDGNVLYTRSFGYSQINGNEKKPLNADTKYRKTKAHRHTRQILPADPQRRQNHHRAHPRAPQRYP
jgi:hypothetical protein